MEIRPQAMAIPSDTNQLEQGKYGPIYPKTPACYGFSILAKIIPGREPVFHEYAKNIENALKAYQKGERDFATMRAMVADLSDKDLQDIAAYYAAQAVTTAEVKK